MLACIKLCAAPLLHVYKVDNGQAIKLAIQMTNDGARVESSFYVPMMTVDGAIKGGLMVVMDDLQ